MPRGDFFVISRGFLKFSVWKDRLASLKGPLLTFSALCGKAVQKEVTLKFFHGISEIIEDILEEFLGV